MCYFSDLCTFSFPIFPSYLSESALVDADGFFWLINGWVFFVCVFSHVYC